MAMIGLKVPLEISQKLSKLSVSGTKTQLDEYHITMFYFEQKLSIQNILDIIKIMYEFGKKTQPLNIKSKTISCFKKGSDGVPIILPIESEDLVDLRNKIARKFDKSEIQYSKKWPEYKPHITLSYSSKEIDNKKIDKSIQWKAEEIVLWSGNDMKSDVITSVFLSTVKKSSFDALHSVVEIFEKLASLE